MKSPQNRLLCALFTVALFSALWLSSAHFPAAAQSTFVATGKPDIGVGLEGLSDWSRAKMFADAMKTSRSWGRTDRPWEHQVKTDEHGWPLEDAGVVVIADVPNIGGPYKLSFTGKADVEGRASRLEIRNLRYDADTNTSRADVVVARDSSQIFLAFLNTSGGVKDVKLFRPGTDENTLFNPDFLEKLAPFSTLRFMDYQSTNNSPVRSWSERTTPQHASQARPQGGALEYIVELANITGKDIWVNVPDQADDDYTRHMARLLKNGLKKDQKVYVEWSNEVWNWQFHQATRNLDAAKTEGKTAQSPLAFDDDTNEGYWAMRRIAQRSAEVGEVFREVFGDQSFERVRPVYAVQVGYEEVYKQGLAFLEHHYGAPGKVLYGLAGAPYFNLNEEEDKNGSITVEQIFSVLPQRVESALKMAEILGSYARYYNLKHLAYEGGQHLQDHGDNGSANAKVAANRDPRMGALIEKYLRGWTALGGDLFIYFTLSSAYNKWGSWGLVDEIANSSPKYEAALRVLHSPPIKVTSGVLLPAEIGAGNFAASNRWDKKGAPEITIEPEKWMQYLVRAPQTGDYHLNARLTAGQSASAQIFINSNPGSTLQIQPQSPNATATVRLEAGLNTIRIQGHKGRFNLHAFQLSR